MFTWLRSLFGRDRGQPARSDTGPSLASEPAPPLTVDEAAFKAEPAPAPPLTVDEAAYKAEPQPAPPLTVDEAAYKAEPQPAPPLAVDEEPEG